MGEMKSAPAAQMLSGLQTESVLFGVLIGIAVAVAFGWWTGRQARRRQ
ncbi:MAG: hypothetical protein AAF416_15545 [Pseudomonadota bacterium]